MYCVLWCSCADDELFITDGPDNLKLMQDMTFDHSRLGSGKCDCCARTEKSDDCVSKFSSFVRASE